MSTGSERMNTIRDNIAAALEARGMSKNALAQATDLGSSYISKLCRGKVGEPSYDVLDRIAQAFGKSVAWLVGAESDEEAKAAAGDSCPLDWIEASPLNPRSHFDEETIDALASSIEQYGLLQNLVVRNPYADQPDVAAPNALKPYALVNGERRLRALKKLKAQGRTVAGQPVEAYQVPIRVVEADEAAHRVLAVVENLQREDVHPLDEAAAFAELRALDWGTKRIAGEVGVSQRYVQQRLSLANLSEKARTAFAEGEINFAAARAISNAPAARQDAVLDFAKGKSDEAYSAEQLSERAFVGMVPTARAIFDEADYDGEIVTAGNGARYFDDEEKFKALQDKAIEARLAELGRQYDHAERTLFFYGPDWRPAEAGEETWAILEVDWKRTVTEHLGLARREEEPLEADEAAWQDRCQAVREETGEIGHKLDEALESDPWARLRLAVFEELVDHWNVPALGSLGALGTRLQAAGLLAEPEEGEAPDETQVTFRDGADPREIMGVIEAAEPDNLVAIAARAMMPRVVFNPWHGLGDLGAALCERHGVEASADARKGIDRLEQERAEPPLPLGEPEGDDGAAQGDTDAPAEEENAA